MTFLQKYALDKTAKEGPGTTAEWKNGKIIAEKLGFTFDEERTEMGIHNYSQHKKRNWLFDHSTDCDDLKRMAHEWKSTLGSPILGVTYQNVNCKKTKWIYIFINNDLHEIT